MIDEIIAELKKIAEESKMKFMMLTRIRFIISYLIIMKYLCESGKYHIDDVIKSREFFEITPDMKRFNHYLGDKCVSVHFLLIKYQDVSSKDLLLEFIHSHEKKFVFTDLSKTLFRGIPDTNYSYYDITGSSTYLYPLKHSDSYFKTYQMFDEILGIHNQYMEEVDIDFTKYQFMFLVDDTPKYRFMKENNEYDAIQYFLNCLKQVTLETSYNKISNFKEGKSIIKSLKTVILHQDEATLIFQKQHQGTISIVNADSEKIKDYNHLQKIIETNRQMKDVLIKTNYEEIKTNNMRIGFQLYQLEQKKDIQDINKIVDENTSYLNDLNRINQTVEREINILLNR